MVPDSERASFGSTQLIFAKRSIQEGRFHNTQSGMAGWHRGGAVSNQWGTSPKPGPPTTTPFAVGGVEERGMV